MRITIITPWMACHRKETHAELKMQRACVFLCVCVPLRLILYLGGFLPPLTDVSFANHVFSSLLTAMKVSQERTWVLGLINTSFCLCFVNQALGTDYYDVEISK